MKPEQAEFTPELARAILELGFDPEDHRRVDEFSAKAQNGTLTAEERTGREGLLARRVPGAFSRPSPSSPRGVLILDNIAGIRPGEALLRVEPAR